MEESFQPGEKVLFFDPRGRTYLVKLQEKGTFHFHGGGIKHDEVLGQPEGVVVTSPKGATLTAVRPRLSDFVLKMPRGAAVVYPKDIGAMLVEADIRPGDRIFEAGTGSGALCIALTRAVGTSGRVVSYELREEHQEKAIRNIETFFGEQPAWLDLHLGDGRDVPDDERFDRFVLDMPQPWDLLDTADRVLRPGGMFCAYLPTTIQIRDHTLALRARGYTQVETLEVLHRTWHVEERSVRPDHRMVGHTGFIVTARFTPGNAPLEEGDVPTDTSEAIATPVAPEVPID